MKFKKIEFTEKNTQRVYDNYIKSVEAAVNPLALQDRQDIMMEMNSHIYESLQNNTQLSEMDVLLNTIDRLGVPEEVLKPLIAEKLLDKATRTFNPLHIITALFYNVANGISYIIFAFLYLFLFAFIFLIGAKILNHEVGMYFYEGKFQALGKSSGEGHYEVLGNWFIPFMLVLTIAWYFFITLLLKLKRSLLKPKAMKSMITSLLFVFIAQFSFGQSPQYAKLDSFFNVLIEEDRFFGSVAISRNNELLYTKAIGYADLENKIENTVDTKFRIGSISKTFTSTLVMKGVELGIIDLDETIDRYFDKIENSESITIRHLLNHRSGITNVTDRNYLSWYTEPISPDALLDSIVVRGVNFEPDADYSYSNSNYILLTFVLEKAFNKTYPSLLEQYIVKPLNLSHTAYGGKISTSNNEAVSYKMQDQWVLEPETDPSIPLGAGGIITTPSDLCRFMEALFKGKLLSIESISQMKPIEGEEYGFALYEMAFDDLIGIGHGGSIDAFSSTAAYIEDQDITIAIVCNGSNFGKHDIIQAVLNEILDRPYNLPSFDNIELSEEELDRYVGVYENESLPIDIDIFRDGKDLILQATGQGEAKLLSEGNHKFSYLRLEVKIQFDLEKEIMNFEQQGMKFVFTRKAKDTSVVEDSPSSVQLSEKELDQYVGKYQSEEIPLDMQITHNGNELFLQATGQEKTMLKAEGEDRFSYARLGVNIKFDPSQNIMYFEQQGMKFTFTREKKSE